MSTILEQFNALSAESQYSVSEYFMDQLRQFPNNPAFFVKASDFKSRLFEFVLTAPTLVGDRVVNVKGQLNHLVLPQGEGESFKLLNVPKKKNGSGGKFNKGYYSPTLEFSQALIDAQLITKSDLDSLVNYVSLWEANGESNYEKGSAAAKQRMWISSRSTNGYMSFVLTERTSPEGDIVPALENVCWTPGDFSIIGQGVTENAQSVHTAPGLALAATTTAPSVPSARVGRSI